ncbi:unnamed protein product, partial [Symbiodinium sp. CCMP2456]
RFRDRGFTASRALGGTFAAGGHPVLWFKLAEGTKGDIEAISAKYHGNFQAGADIWEDGRIRAELVASGKLCFVLGWIPEDQGVRHDERHIFINTWQDCRCLAVTRLRSLYAEALAGLAECCLK